MRRRLLWIAVGFAAAVVGISVLWRWAGRTRSLPCPSWLAWFLGIRWMDSIRGPGAILDRLGVEPGMWVLDAGAGPGRVTIPAARRVAPDGVVVALDIQAAMLRRLERRATEAGVTNIRTVRAGLGEGALGKDRFDRAWLVTVLGEVPDRVAALREIHGALKPGGLLAITEIFTDPHYQRIATARELAAQTGFQVEHVYGTWRAYTLIAKREA